MKVVNLDTQKQAFPIGSLYYAGTNNGFIAISFFWKKLSVTWD